MAGMPKASRRNHDLPKTEKEWVRYVNECHDGALHARRKFEWQWTVNLCYYMGFHNLWSYNGSLRVDLDDPELTVNRIAQFVEARHAKVTKSRPVSRNVPNSNDPEDLYGAKYANMALRSLWRKIEMETVQDDTVMPMLITGNAFQKTVWDAHQGQRFVDDTTDDGDIKLTEKFEPEQKSIFEGEVSTSAKTPFAILPANDNIKELRQQMWVCERVFMTKEEIEDRWPKLIGKVHAKEDQFQRTEYERIVQRLASPSFTRANSWSNKIDSVNSEILVKEFWMKPNGIFESGVVAVVIGDELAMIDEWPNDYGDAIYPYVHFKEHNTGFHFWSPATVQRLIPIQRAYNELRQQKVKNARLMANAKWLNPKGSQVPEDAFSDEEGEVIEYNPSVPTPQQASISPLPNYVENLEATLLNDFTDAGGQRAAPFTPPPNISASVAIQTLNELSEEVLIPISRRYGRSMSLVAQTQMSLMNQEYLEPRMIKVLGDSMAGVVFLKNTDFRNNTDVHIEIESLIPELRASKKQAVLELWDRRVITDPATFVEVFRHGNFDRLVDNFEKAKEQFVLDLRDLKRGKAPDITPFQDHMQYVRGYMEFISTPEFNRMIPERKQQVIDQLQKHIAFVQQQSAQQTMNQPNAANTNTPSGPQRPEGVA